MKTLDDLIATISVGAPSRHQALSVYPLTSMESCKDPDYLVLEEALATGLFQITEISEAGSVPRLLAINGTNSPVLLLDGEELIGAKQNRVLNLSIMLAPTSKTEIPVSCVEAGRWRMDRAAFGSSKRVHFARGRAQKMEHVSRSLHRDGYARSNQTEIWDTIAGKAGRMHVASCTGAMADMFDSYNDDLNDYQNAIPTVDGQIGAIYAFGDRLAGIEVFDSDATYRKLADKVLASYALDAMEMPSEREAPYVDAVYDVIKDVGGASRQPHPNVGMGEMLRLSGRNLVGAALDVDGSCVHLAAFRRQTFEQRPYERNPSEPRMSRSSNRARRS